MKSVAGVVSFVLAVALVTPLSGRGLVHTSEVPTVGEVWPYPYSIERGSQEYQLLSGLTHTILGANCPMLDRAIERMFLVLKTMPTGPGVGRGEECPENQNERVLMQDLYINLLHNCEDLPYLHMDESYTLTAGTDDNLSASANLTATSIWGMLHALESFTQLFLARDGELYITDVQIVDQPRFAFRGFMIDTSRHYLPLASIKDILDLMSINKLNVLHWHIVDSQSFPYKSRVYPDLSTEGAWTPMHVYKAQDMTEVVLYAADRGIRVLPEFDTPGHTDSWGLGQPGLLTPCYSNGAPDGSYGPVDPTLDENYEFLAILFAEVGERFPDHYLHLGGDEVPFGCWESNPSIKEFMTDNDIQNYNALEDYYFSRLLPIVSGLPSAKGYLVWQEVFDNNVNLANDTVVHVWKDMTDLPKVTAAGFQTVLSSCYYLNYIQYGNDWVQYYECDPHDFEGSDDQKRLVVGGEACMWGEFVDRTNLIASSFPTGSAVAEKLWTPLSLTGDAAMAGPRLEQHRCRMYDRGYSVQPLGPSSCAADLY